MSTSLTHWFIDEKLQSVKCRSYLVTVATELTMTSKYKIYPPNDSKDYSLIEAKNLQILIVQVLICKNFQVKKISYGY